MKIKPRFKIFGEELAIVEITSLVIGAVAVISIMVGVWLIALNSGYAGVAIG